MNKELDKKLQHKAYRIGKELEKQRYTITEIGELFPVNFIIDNVIDPKNEYINQHGLDILHTSQEELSNMKQDYYLEFFDPTDTINRIIPMMENFVINNDEHKTLSFFHQVRPQNTADFEWYHFSGKLLKLEGEEQPERIIGIATHIKDMAFTEKKVARLIEEEQFANKHFPLFDLLSKREKEILALIASGYTNPQIADKFFLSRSTVETHRKKIIRKLDIKGKNSVREMIRYALAFELI